MCKLLTTLVVSAILSCGSLGTGKGRVENALGSRVREVCGTKQECTIRIDEVTSFDWDSVTVFSSGLTYVEKNKVLGKDYFTESKYGLSNALVFSDDGKIVYAEENIRDVEGIQPGDTYFSDMDSAKHYRVYRRDSVFEVERKRLADGEYYSFRCMNCSD